MTIAGCGSKIERIFTQKGGTELLKYDHVLSFPEEVLNMNINFLSYLSLVFIKLPCFNNFAIICDCCTSLLQLFVFGWTWMDIGTVFHSG